MRNAFVFIVSFAKRLTHSFVRPIKSGAASWSSAKHVFSVLATAAALSVLLVGGGSESYAGQERYEYDPIGRLVRYVDSAGQVTDYNYDAAGNVLSVVKGGAASSYLPTLSAITPSFIRRGETRPITLTGQGLLTGTLLTSDNALDIGNLRQTATQIQADLSVGLSAATGAQTLTYSNASGSASIGIVVGPSLPELSVEPSPLALPPDNSARAITLRLSGPDLVTHQISVASTNTAKATISPASVTLLAGQTSVQVSITSKSAGFVNLVLTSPTLRTATVPVFITADFRGVNTSYANMVGVVVGDAEPPVTSPTTLGTLASPRIGIAVGAVLTELQPKSLVLGSNTSLVIRGANIPSAVQVTAVPAAGLTLGSPVVSADGRQIAVPLAVDAAAVPGPRLIVVTDAANAGIAFADYAQSQLVLTTGQPVVASVGPLFATAGTTVRIKVNGRHLQNGQLTISPGVDLRVDSQPVVNADGTELLAYVQIASLAVKGPRTVQITTPSGTSSDAPTVANQFSIVSEIKADIGPISAPLVGVMVGTSTSAQVSQTITPIASPNVGVAVGAFAQTMSPKVGVIGTSVNLAVNGQGLQAVQSVSLLAPSGLTLGAFTVNSEGTQITVPVTIDASAAKTLRRLILNTASGPLSFTDPSADSFLVAAPAPAVASASPQVLKAGLTINMSLQGVNFRDVQAVRFEPPQGITVQPSLLANSDGTQLGLSVVVAANAVSGPRTVVVVTAGGESSAVQVPANTVYVAQQTGPTYADIMALSVGVQVGTVTVVPVTTPLDVYAPAVGVLVESSAAVQDTTTRFLSALNVGVIVGTGITSTSPAKPDGFLKGSAGTLIFSGVGLDQVSSITLTGTSTGAVTLGSATVNAAGTALSLPISVGANAASGAYRVNFYTGSGTSTVAVSSANLDSTLFRVGSLPSLLGSVAPIVLEQGKAYSFTVRGTGLQDVYQLLADPASGVNFGADLSTVQWSIDALGEKFTIQVAVSTDAPIGSRVIRLRVPGGLTDATPLPANTITVVAPL